MIGVVQADADELAGARNAGGPVSLTTLASPRLAGFAVLAAAGMLTALATDALGAADGAGVASSS